MECKRGQYNPFEVITINDEKWVIIEIHYGVSNYITCHPLTDFIIDTTCIHLKGEHHPVLLADYIEQIVVEYERRRAKNSRGENYVW